MLSYQRRSLALLLLARLLNGLGSARAANRRYTADYVSKWVGGCSAGGQAVFVPDLRHAYGSARIAESLSAATKKQQRPGCCVSICQVG